MKIEPVELSRQKSIVDQDMFEQGVALAANFDLVNTAVEGKIVDFSTGNTQRTRHLSCQILHLYLEVNKLRPLLEFLQKLLPLQHFFLVLHSLAVLMLFNNQPIIIDRNRVQFISSLYMDIPRQFVTVISYETAVDFDALLHEFITFPFKNNLIAAHYQIIL